MTEQQLPSDLLALLRTVDTPTVCNAIEVAQGQRGFDRFTKGTMQHSRPGQPPAVGFARTAKIAGLAPPTEDPAVIRSRRMDYFRSMAAGPGPSVAIVEDTDFPNCIAGWWGEVHAAVHKGLGLAGAVTNGVMRDLDVMDEEFPVLAGSIGVSHGFVHVVEIGTPVEVFGITVEQGELIHADRHGAVIVPHNVAAEVPAAAELIGRREALLLAASARPDFSIDDIAEAYSKAADIH